MSSYSELHRPQFHFSAKKNWINDPNGLVYHDGIWHLFFQHNIEAPTWGPMWWGHAVSNDLLHWRQLDHALHPDEMGSMFSGSAVIDHHNAAGFGKDAMLLFYTAAGSHATPARPFVQCLAFSVDGGQTFNKYEHNPIVDWMQADNRDPKVVWDAASQKWVMALYLEDERYCLLSSSDLKEWSHLQDIVLPGTYECPDFFPLVDEDGVNRWVFSGAGSGYLVGQFDGNKFVAETELSHYDGGPNNYAAQTWSNAPDGRCVQISWMAGGLYPEMPFNQQLSIPVELCLLGTGSNARLARRPKQGAPETPGPSQPGDWRGLPATPHSPPKPLIRPDIETASCRSPRRGEKSERKHSHTGRFGWRVSVRRHRHVRRRRGAVRRKAVRRQRRAARREFVLLFRARVAAHRRAG